MSGRRSGLQKNVQNIFEDADLSDELYAKPVSDEPSPAPAATVVTPEEELPVEADQDQPESDVVAESLKPKRSSLRPSRPLRPSLTRKKLNWLPSPQRWKRPLFRTPHRKSLFSMTA